MQSRSLSLLVVPVSAITLITAGCRRGGIEMKIMVLALVLLLLGSGPASACWCVGQTLQEWFDSSDAVFSGICISQEPGDFDTRMEFMVTACWKGVSVQGSTVIVFAPGPYWDCSWGAGVGQEWVIYGGNYPGGFFTDQCKPNEQVPLSPEHAAFLGPSTCTPLPVEAETWGKIKAIYR